MSSMVLTFDTSSSTSHQAIWLTSKGGHDPQSTPLLVKQSHEPYLSFDCPSAGNVCHWGDYSGAAPDPIANPRAPRGVVWGASEWNVANPTPSSATAWRTWIFTASPGADRVDRRPKELGRVLGKRVIRSHSSSTPLQGRSLKELAT